MKEMKRMYIITRFDFKTDITMDYQLKSRSIVYSMDDLKSDIRYLLEETYNEYKEITSTDISYDDFYNKSDLILEAYSISLNHKGIITEDEYNTYLSEVKNIPKEKLKDYLLDKVICLFGFDHNLNLKYAYSSVIDDPNFNDYYNQYAFSYKALFPEKYHVDKYIIGDAVLYEGKKYIIDDVLHPDKNIYESDDPLNYRYGYILYDEYNTTPDDKFGYYPVDEDLESVKG